MQKGDIRAVENPISAVFDLAEEVNEQAPRIRRLIGWSRLFIGIWLFVNFVFLLFLAPSPLSTLLMLPLVGLLFVSAVALRWAEGPAARVFLFLVIALSSGAIALLTGPTNLFLGVILAVLFVLGIVILNVMRDIRAFFGYYVLRHRAIQSVREEDPVVYVPQGEDAVHRLLTYLSERHPELRGQSRQGFVQTGAVLKGKSGLLYNFDAYILGRPSALWRPLGLGETGYALYVKHFATVPTVKDLEALKRAVEDVSLAQKVPPTRVIALWTPEEEERLGDEAYEYLTSEVVTFRHGGQVFRCSLELVMEAPDGTYDFIPYVTEALYA